MQLQFASLEDRILWHVVRELNHAAGNVGVPNLVQTLSDFGPAAVVRVIEQLQETDE
jgi:predicted component of type VI protein secretion system